MVSILVDGLSGERAVGCIGHVGVFLSVCFLFFPGVNGQQRLMTLLWRMAACIDFSTTAKGKSCSLPCTYSALLGTLWRAPT